MLSFYLHRFLRIAPLFYLLLAFSIFRDGRGSHAGHPWAEIVANATFTFNLFPGWEQGIVWASWAVGVEMLFYAIFPLLYLLVDNGRRAWTLLLVLLGLAALAGTGALGARAEASLGGYGWLTHAPVFAMGLVAFHAYNALSQLSPARARWWGKALNMVGALLLLLVVAGIAAGWNGAGPWQVAGLGYLAVLLGCSQCPPRLLVNRATAWLGTVSYSLYLGHPIVIAVLGPVLRRLLAVVGDGTTGYLLCAVLVLAVALPLAALGQRCIEAPMIRLGKRVMASLSASRAGSSPRQAEGGPR